MTSISLSFTPAQLNTLRYVVAANPNKSDPFIVEMLARIDSAIDARTFWDRLTQEQRDDATDLCVECSRDDVYQLAVNNLLLDPDIDEMTNYTTPDED